MCKKYVVTAIESGLQCVNAFEAIEWIGADLSDCRFIVLVNKSQIRKKKLIQKMLNELAIDPGSIFYIDGDINKMKSTVRSCFPNQVLKRISAGRRTLSDIRRVVREFENPQNTFISMRGAIYTELGRQCKANQHVVIDGGTSKLEHIKLKSELENPDFVLRLVGFRSWVPQSVIHFTSYYQSTIDAGFHAIANNYSRVKRSLRTSTVGDSIAFIGLPMRNGEKIWRQYVDSMSRIVSGSEVGRVIFFPHPSDRPLSNTLLTQMNKPVEIVNDDLPVEFSLARLSPLPIRIVTSISSSTLNLDAIFGDIVKVSVMGDVYLNQLLFDQKPQREERFLELKARGIPLI